MKTKSRSKKHKGKRQRKNETVERRLASEKALRDEMTENEDAIVTIGKKIIFSEGELRDKYIEEWVELDADYLSHGRGSTLQHMVYFIRLFGWRRPTDTWEPVDWREVRFALNKLEEKLLRKDATVSIHESSCNGSIDELLSKSPWFQYPMLQVLGLFMVREKLAPVWRDLEDEINRSIKLKTGKYIMSARLRDRIRIIIAEQRDVKLRGTLLDLFVDTTTNTFRSLSWFEVFFNGQHSALAFNAILESVNYLLMCWYRGLFECSPRILAGLKRVDIEQRLIKLSFWDGIKEIVQSYEQAIKEGIITCATSRNRRKANNKRFIFVENNSKAIVWYREMQGRLLYAFGLSQPDMAVYVFQILKSGNHLSDHLDNAIKYLRKDSKYMSLYYDWSEIFGSWEDKRTDILIC